MRILLAEDNDDKREKIISFLLDNFPQAYISEKKSLQSTLKAVFSEEYDLILLDMTMTNFDRTLSEDGGRPHAFAGREILRQMSREHIETPTIVITHFDRFGEEANYMTLDELNGELASNFSNYVDTVQYKGNIDDWKPHLISLIEKCEIA